MVTSCQHAQRPVSHRHSAVVHSTSCYNSAAAVDSGTSKQHWVAKHSFTVGVCAHGIHIQAA